MVLLMDVLISRRSQRISALIQIFCRTCMERRALTLFLLSVLFTAAMLPCAFEQLLSFLIGWESWEPFILLIASNSNAMPQARPQ